MLNKYIISFKSGVRQQLAEKSQLVGRCFVYFVVVYVFFQVFESVNASLFQFSYFAMTQAISLSTSLLAFQIAQDMQNGQVAHFLVRPMNYVLYRLTEAIGISFVRYLLFIFCYLAVQFYLKIALSVHTLEGILFGMAGVFLHILLTTFIGICSFWIRDIKSIVYLNLTATFCFGGLIVPLTDYSPLMQSIAFLTPYPWILWWPAAWASGDSIDILSALLAWFSWTILLSFLIAFAYKKCIRSFVAEGG